MNHQIFERKLRSWVALGARLSQYRFNNLSAAYAVQTRLCSFYTPPCHTHTPHTRVGWIMRVLNAFVNSQSLEIHGVKPANEQLLRLIKIYLFWIQQSLVLDLLFSDFCESSGLRMVLFLRLSTWMTPK